MKQEKADKILSQLSSSTPMNQPQLAKHIPIRGGLERAGLRRIVSGTNNYLNQRYFLNHLKFKSHHYLLKCYTSQVHKENK